MADDVVLTLGGQHWAGWTGIVVQRSIEAIAGTFTLSLTDRWPGQDQRRPLSVGAACRVAIDGETIITGAIDDVEPGYDATGHSLTVRGRDATGDLVDASAVHEPGEWSGLDATAIATALAAPFGIEVRAETDVGGLLRKFHIEEGETAFEAIERLCRMRAVLPVSDGMGSLVLTRAGASGAVPEVVRGGSGGAILAARGKFTQRGRHDRYIVKGQQSGDDAWLAEDNALQAAEARDAGVGRYRPLIVLAED